MGKKSYDSFKIIWHPEKLKSLKEGNVMPPVYVRVKPTNKCNHNCFYCVYEPDFSGIHNKTNRNDEIPYEKMIEILEDFKNMGVKALTYSGGGEPLVYPYIKEILKKTLDYGIDLSMITNGQSLKGEFAEILSNAKWIRISSDSVNPKMFLEIRRRPERMFEELMNNIKDFAKIKKPDCVLGVNFVVHNLNNDNIYEAAELYKSLGVNHIKFSAAWKSQGFHEYHKEIKAEVIEQIEKAKKELQDENFEVYDTYEKDLNLTGVSERSYDRCFIMQTVPVIGADCNVYFCHNKAYSEDGKLGSIKGKSFKELWFSKESLNKFKNFNPMESCKHQCTNDSKNLLIKQLIDSCGEHVNFV
ncbi:MAG: radical SAM protein [Nanoarchaeota archaeon]|nr:radical SAM protein [Nanoarchaeota archaeon]